MDAAQTSKRLALFLAGALLLTAPFSASAQTLSVSTTSVAIGSSQCNDFQNVTIASSSGTPSFTVGINYGANNQEGLWLYASVLGNGSTNSATTFTTQATAAGVPLTIGLNLGIGSATPTATVVVQQVDGSGNPVGNPINITVYYTQNTSCGGNTGSATNGFVTATPGNVAISTATNTSGSQPVTLQNTTGSVITFTYLLNPSNSWLSATTTTASISANGSTSINVTANGAQTGGAGTYTGILTITPSVGSSINLNVTLTVGSGTGTGTGSNTLTLNNTTSNTFTTSFSYTAPNLPGSLCIPLQDTASGASSYQTVVTTSGGGNWLLANYQISTTTSQVLAPGTNACVTLSLSNSLTGLSSGAYQGSVAITSSSGATGTITVNLYVSAGVAPGITVTPSAIYTFQNVAANSSTLQQQPFSLSGASGYSLGTASLTNSANGVFTITTPSNSNNTESFTVTANPAGQGAGIYAGTITMSSSSGGGGSSTTTITVILPVGQGGSTITGNTTNTVVAPASLTFQQQVGSSYWTSNKEAQNVTITGNSGTNWSAAVTYPTNGPSNWLTFDNPSSGSGTFGSGPATLAVDLFNASSLAASTTPYTATVNITTTNGNYTVAVSLLVTASAVLLADPGVTTFSATSNTSLLASQTVTVVGSDATGSTTGPSLAVGSPSQSWLNVAVNGNVVSLSANPSGQNTGVYTATVQISSTAYSNPITYPVVLIVNGGGTGSSGPLSISTASLPFTNVTAALSQSFTVTTSTSTAFNATSSETSCISSNWLSINPSGALNTSSNSTINVTVNPSGIANGTVCTGTVSLVTQSATQSVSTQSVSVSMTVGTATGSGNVTVTPTTMSFGYTQTQSVPAAQTATIASVTSGAASIPFTVTITENTSPSTSWLVANVQSGTTPYNNLSVSVVPASLSPGTYTGTVNINPSAGTTVPINVTLTVSAAAAVITATVQGASAGNTTNMALTYNVGGTSPTGTILVSGGGASAGFTATASSNQGWLQVSPTSGTTANSGTNNLTVSVVSTVLGSLFPSTTPYTGTVTIAATAPATGTTIINVSLTVSAPLPVITGVTNAASGAVGAVSPGELISIFANPSNPIGPTNAVQLNSTTCPSPCSVVPNQMGGVQVKFLPGGYFAPLIFVTAGQINAVVPYEIAGQVSVSVEVLYLNQTSNAFPLNVAATAPGIFTANASGSGPAAALEYNSSGYAGVNSATNPAGKGYYLVLYLTGEGKLTTNVADGAVTSSTSTTPPVPVIAPTGILIGGQPATIAGYSEAPGIVSGVLQINVIVPAGAGTGPQSISVSFGTTATQANTTVYLM